MSNPLARGMGFCQFFTDGRARASLQLLQSSGLALLSIPTPRKEERGSFTLVLFVLLYVAVDGSCGGRYRSTTWLFIDDGVNDTLRCALYCRRGRLIARLTYLCATAEQSIPRYVEGARGTVRWLGLRCEWPQYLTFVLVYSETGSTGSTGWKERCEFIRL